jgi:NADPH-dependent glutamate synthase beta subunit-like oxidoreductase
MKKFKYVKPKSIQEATSILGNCTDKARIIAGGTDLLGQMQDNILPGYPEVLVNLKGIPNLDYIRQEKGTLRIGSLTKLDEIARDGLIKMNFGLLADAAAKTASPHIREMGTIGGNICQSNRCWYYWVPDNRFYCLRKGGAACYAAVGDARYHSIFGSTRVQATPCTRKCPAGVLIPEYLDQIREGRLEEAARILLKSNPLPSITGRVCPHPCESECNRLILDESVSIRCLERYLGDYILQNPKILLAPPAARTKKQIAIVGSGPAGLSAACYLNNLGHNIAVFESMDKAGGLLEYGIPSYRLPKEVVRQQIEAIRKMGIKIKTGVKIGRDVLFEDIRQNYDAVFVACGAWQERPSGIKGEQFMLSGVEFLRNLNSDQAEIAGNNIAVIGGGNVAIDVARTLLRSGAKPVIIYRRSRPEMPALKEEIEKAEEENIAFKFLTVPVEVYRIGERTILKCISLKLGPADISGRPQPLPIAGSEHIIEFDAVIKALGEEPDASIIPHDYLDAYSQLRKDRAGYSLGGNLFAGGDFITGGATVVEAIAAGRAAAGVIGHYLGGKSSPPEMSSTSASQESVGVEGKEESGATGCLHPDRFNSYSLKKSKRAKPAELPVAERTRALNVEEAGGLDKNAIETEANRCLNCGCVAVNSSDIAPALIAMDAVIRTTRRMIKADQFFTVSGDKTTVLDDAEIVIEIEIPQPGPETKFKFIKFALRKSIDFPVVNCAAAISCEKGKVTSARICLNAVYNQPYRVTGAEEYLVGKLINEDSAEMAAGEITANALPLINNAYKIQIARTLVKRAILACL